MVTFGTPKIAHSSCTVPLSDSTARAFFSSFTKSKNPSGLSSRTSDDAGRICPSANLLAVCGWTLTNTGDLYVAAIADNPDTILSSRAESSTFSARCIVAKKYAPGSTWNRVRISLASIGEAYAVNT